MYQLTAHNRLLLDDLEKYLTRFAVWLTPQAHGGLEEIVNRVREEVENDEKNQAESNDQASGLRKLVRERT